MKEEQDKEKDSKESKDSKDVNTNDSPQEYLKFVNILTIVWTVFSMLYLSAVTFFVVPDGNNRNVDLILGFLIGTAISSLLNFHFGSSRSSVNKDKQLEQMRNKEQQQH